ncbi:MAG TPA: homoserine kinase [Beijerinckiaceae bacterium]|nr:homoserine kinase [Beijerinckiaceae bacterium]
MAVYTEVSVEDLNAFLRPYDLGAIKSFRGIAEGVENSNYVLETERGRYILTLYEKRVREDDLPFFLGLMEHLQKRGINCPQPVRARDGQILHVLSGRPAAIVTFLDGVSYRRPSVAHCAELGRVLAELHVAGADYAIRRANALSLQGWRPLYAQTGGRGDEVAPGLERLITDELGELETRWPGDLPAGVIHADLFPNNVLFLGDRLTGVIDFYFACNDAYAYDLAICLNAWCFESDFAFNLTKGKALIAAYQTIRRLEDREVEALPLLCRGSALRFLLTRLVDYLNVPPGALVRPLDPREYMKRLRFHRGVKDASAYGLAP